ncbi:MAG TPA: hypothetical protein PLF21_04760 [Exilispira sp.]|nr:hypothetical protein [Exilispira sp.]
MGKIKIIFFILLLIFFISQNVLAENSQISIDCTSFLFNSFIEFNYSYYLNPFFSIRFNLGYSFIVSNLFLFEFGFAKYAKEYSGLFLGIDFGLVKWTSKSVDFGGYLFNLFLGYRLKIGNFFADLAVMVGMLSQSLCIENELVEGTFIGFNVEVGYLF